MAETNTNRANYITVALTIIVGLAAIFASLLYFGGLAGQDEVVFAETYYNHSVSGLSVGSEVNFKGVKIGEVKEISFVGAKYDEAAENDREKINILFCVKRNLLELKRGCRAEETLQSLIKRGLRATVSASGITGLAKLELSLHPDKAAAEKTSWLPRHICIPPEPSIIDSFSDSATAVMNHLKKVDFQSVFTNLNTIVENVAELTDNANDLVKSERGNVEALIATLNRAVESLEQFAAKISDSPSLLLRSREAESLPETNND